MSLRMLFSNRRIVIGAVIALVVASAIIGGTVAYFSDTETSVGNTFVAGKLNLKIDNTCHYNGKECKLNDSGDYVWEGTEEPCFCTWQLADILQNQLFFHLLDVKPGDSGEDTISFHIDNNPAWLCAEIFDLQNNENGCDTPENKIDFTCHYPGNEGELGQNLFFSVWKDNGAGNHACNNVKDADEGNYIIENKNAIAGIWPIVDSTNGAPLPGGTTICYGISWNVPLSTSNIIQSDALVGSLRFTAVQSRHMDTFKCADLTSTACTPLNNGVEICGNGLDEDCNGSDLACAPICIPQDEVCDNQDNNCNAQIDEGTAWQTKGEACSVGRGECMENGTLICNPNDPTGSLICSVNAGTPGTEICNGLDDDCDGVVDEENVCQ